MRTELINRIYPGAKVKAISQVFCPEPTSWSNKRGWNDVLINRPDTFDYMLRKWNQEGATTVHLILDTGIGADFKIHELLT